MRNHWAKGLLLLFIAAIAVSGCATYHELPLNQAGVARELTPPDMEVIRIEAKAIKHPILKPFPINDRDGLSPEEAALIAVLVNPKLRALRDQRGVARAQLLEAGILPNPQLSYGLNFPTGGDSANAINDYGLGLGWDIQTLITRGARVDAAKAQALSVDLDVAWREWQAAQAARQQVYRLILLKKQISVAKEGEKGLQKNRDAVKQAVDMGDMTAIDLSAAEAALQAVQLTLLVTEQQMKTEQLALKKSLGFPPEGAVFLEAGASLPEVLELPSLTTLMNGIEDRRLDLLALKMGYQSQDERVRAAVLAQFPRINIGFLQARDNSNVVSTGFTVSIDLPFFDRNQGRIAIQQATRKQLFDEYVDRLFEARSNVATILADMASIQEQIGATERALPTLKDVVEKYRRALLDGMADVLSYYNVVNELIAKRLELLRLKQSLMDQNIALEIAAGRYLGGEEAMGVRN